MPRESFSRRRWLALVAGGLTAGCGGRAGLAKTATPTETPTPTPTETPVAVGSFERGAGECTLDGPDVLAGTWPMPGHDAGRTNHAAAENGPERDSFPLNRRWTVASLASSIYLPASDKDALYVVAARDEGDGRTEQRSTVVLSHDPHENGEVRWRHRSPEPPAGPPTLVGDAVYVPIGPPSDVNVVALDRADGSPVSRHSLPPKFEGALSAVGDHLLVPAEGGYVVTEAQSGKHCWTFSPNDADATVGEGRHIRATAAADGTAYVGTGYPDSSPTTEVGHLFAVDPSIGGVRWDATLDGPVGGVAVREGVVVAATGDRVVGFDTETGNTRWQMPSGDRVRPATLALTDELAVYGTRRTLSAVDRQTGESRWTKSFGVRGDVIVVGDVLYAVGRFDPTTKRFQILALDVGSGRQRWRLDLYDPVVGVSAAHGYLYIITERGRLFAFNGTT